MVFERVFDTIISRGSLFLRLFWTLPSTVLPNVELLDLDMTGLPNNAFASPNFAFLTKYDEVLVRHAALAERYVFDDPNSALLKLRQFGELLAQHAAACTGVAVEERDSQLELIHTLLERQVINTQVSQLLHGLRKSGN